MALFVLAFFAGALTVLAPCVLPLLPVIIGGSVSSDTHNKTRPYIIAISLAASLFLFTILLKASTAFINVSPQVWLDISGGILVALGLVSLFPHVWETIIDKLGVQTRSQELLEKSSHQPNRTLSAILIGASLGPVFSSCSPTYAFILATILPKNYTQGIIDLLAYCAGLVVILLIVSLSGRRAIEKFKWASNPYGIFRRVLGIIFIVIGIAIIGGYDKKIETWAANHMPLDIAKLDQSLLQRTTKPAHKSVKSDNSVDNVVPYEAPNIAGISAWINSSPQSIHSLHGKVVLVDFWTYSCINCIRSIPHVEGWYQQYNKDGFVVIGVSAPEFAFEQKESNVQAAVNRLHITYPVALDNNLDTWNNFQNQYWPADYLIDKSGKVRNVHFGEGDYKKTEQDIRTLLGVNSGPLTNVKGQTASSNVTPETYFGLQRAAGFAGSPDLSSGTLAYSKTASLKLNEWDLSGDWQEENEQITSQSDDATLRFHVQAKDVYVVVDPPSDAPQTIQVTLSGSGKFASDDPGGQLTITGARLYHIASMSSVTDTTVTLRVPTGISLNTFTFG